MVQGRRVEGENLNDATATFSRTSARGLLYFIGLNGKQQLERRHLGEHHRRASGEANAINKVEDQVAGQCGIDIERAASCGTPTSDAQEHREGVVEGCLKSCRYPGGWIDRWDGR